MTLNLSFLKNLRHEQRFERARHFFFDVIQILTLFDLKWPTVTSDLQKTTQSKQRFFAWI